MRIGIMCHSGYGGSGRIALELAQELCRRGHRVHLFSRTTPFGVWDPASGVALHRMAWEREDSLSPSGFDVDWSEQDFKTFTAQVLRVIAAEGLDVLHFHYALPFAFVAAAVKERLKSAAPVLVGTLHGTDVSLYGRRPATRVPLAGILQDLDGLTTVSHSHARLARQVFGLSRAPEVIPNFVDLSRFHPPGGNGKGRGHPGPRRPRLIHVSNFRPVKDPKSLAAIFLGIRARLQAELWLVGDGPELSKVATLFRRRGVADNVRYFGLRPQVAPLLGQADLLLMSSRAESFCLAALEAMACGVPVLATQVGGLPEVVRHGETGFLYAREEHTQAVDLALGLLADPARLRDMGLAAASRARLFGHAEIINAYETYYEGLLAWRRWGEAPWSVHSLNLTLGANFRSCP